MNASGDRAALVWMDTTTSWREREACANGTLRVEASYASALRQVLGPQLRFCRFAGTAKRFVPIAVPRAPDAFRLNSCGR